MMLHLIAWCWVGLIAAGLGVVVLGWVRRPRGERRLCPRRIGSRAVLVLPAAWVWPRRCGFDLTGLAEGSRCPECGGTTRALRRLRGRPGYRPVVLGLLLVVTGGTLRASVRLAGGDLAPYLPSLVLVSFEGDGAPLERKERQAFEDELQERVWNGSVTGYAAELLVDRLVDDLGSDKERWNAMRATGMLGQLYPASRAALEGALGSGDPQARHLAWEVLRDRCPGDPSEALLIESVRQLGDDSGSGVTWYLRRGNQIRAAEYLVGHARAVERLLVEALEDDDPQRNVLAASVLAEAGLGGASPEVARVLVEHLGDNTLGGDGCLAARALYVIGMDALPALDTAWTDPDPQRRAWARAIAAHLRGTSWHALEPGLEQHRLSTISRDPLRESFGWCLRRIR